MSQTAALHNLQLIDNQLSETRSRLAEIRHLLNEDAAVQAFREALTQSEGELHDWQTKQAALENERARLQNEANTTEQRLYSGQVFNPRELGDLQDKLVEINRRRQSLEEPTLEAMMSVDELVTQIAARRVAFEQALAQRAEETGAMGNEELALKTRLADLEAESERARAAIETAALSLYDKVRAKVGYSVTTIKGTECGACGVGLTSQIVQQVRRGEISPCPTCGRILYI